MADIEASHKPDRADTIEIEAAKTLPKWVRHLSAGVCNAFDCQALHHPAHGKMTFIGVGADAQVAAYTYTYLARTIKKLCSSYMKDHIDDIITARDRELRRHSYYLGAVSTVTARLEKQKVSTPVTSGALVPLKQALIRQAINEVGNIRTVHSRRSYLHPDAYSTGQNDGRRVGIHQGIEQEKSMIKKLLQ